MRVGHKNRGAKTFAALSCRPNYGSGGYPQTCGGTYSSTAISSIRTRMNTQWPSFSGSNDVFWSHEYENHGTCAGEHTWS